MHYYELDLFFERAIAEGMRETYERRQHELALMDSRSDEETLYRELMELQTRACLNSSLCPEELDRISDAAMRIQDMYSPYRYWTYVYAKQAEEYRRELVKSDIDVDAMEADYNIDELIELFKKHFALLAERRLNSQRKWVTLHWSVACNFGLGG